MKYIETGRSMVEILGVLAVVGLLSVGGIEGYRLAIDKHKANEVQEELRKRANEMSHQMQNGIDPVLDDFADEVDGVKMEMMASDNEGFKPDFDDSQFAILVQNVPEGMAKQLLNDNAGLRAGIVGIKDSNLNRFVNSLADLTPNSDGSYDMAYIFDSTMDGICPAGQYVKDNKCVNCPDGKVCTGGTDFTECPAARKPNATGSACIACSEGEVCGCPHMSDGHGKCVDCIKNSDCGEKICYNSVCYPCPEHGNCTIEKGFTCQEGYHVQNSLCCPDHATCDDITGEVLSCATGYYVNNNECRTCPPWASCVGGTNDYTCTSGNKENGICCPEGAVCEVSDKDADGDGVPDYTVTCPEGQLLSEDNECVECPTGQFLYQGKCISSCPNGLVTSNFHCCPLSEPVYNGVMCTTPKPEDLTFEGADGLDWNCNIQRAIQVNGVKKNCEVCSNREVISNYCVPKCGDGKFLQRREQDMTKPEVYCTSCDANTGWMVGPPGLTPFCEAKCPNRESYNLGFNQQYQCQLKECPAGTVSCNNGCCSCDTLESINVSKWYAGGSGRRANANTSCLACNGKYGKRKMTTNGYCYLENCPAGYFRNGNDCIACSSGTSYKVSLAECNKCVDATGKLTRHFEDNYCVKGNVCANGTIVNSDGQCGECPENTFKVAGKCISCDDPKAYSAATDATECARCNGKRVMHSARDVGTTCMLKAEVGKSFYSSKGTLSCDDPTMGAVVYTRNADCFNYCPNRIGYYGDNSSGSYYCSFPCPKGTFASTDGDSLRCYACDSEDYHGLTGVRKTLSDPVAAPACSTVCPGQRYSRNGYCTKCPTGTYSIGENATSCETCPENLSDLTEGACTACGGIWNGMKCHNKS